MFMRRHAKDANIVSEYIVLMGIHFIFSERSSRGLKNCPKTYEKKETAKPTRPNGSRMTPPPGLQIYLWRRVTLTFDPQS